MHLAHVARSSAHARHSWWYASITAGARHATHLAGCLSGLYFPNCFFHATTSSHFWQSPASAPEGSLFTSCCSELCLSARFGTHASVFWCFWPFDIARREQSSGQRASGSGGERGSADGDALLRFGPRRQQCGLTSYKYSTLAPLPYHGSLVRRSRELKPDRGELDPSTQGTGLPTPHLNLVDFSRKKSENSEIV